MVQFAEDLPGRSVLFRHHDHVLLTKIEISYGEVMNEGARPTPGSRFERIERLSILS